MDCRLYEPSQRTFWGWPPLGRAEPEDEEHDDKATLQKDSTYSKNLTDVKTCSVKVNLKCLTIINKIFNISTENGSRNNGYKYDKFNLRKDLGQLRS